MESGVSVNLIFMKSYPLRLILCPIVPRGNKVVEGSLIN